MKDEYYLYTFESTHGAIMTEKLFKPIGVVVMPVPRLISTSCGIAVRVEPEKLAESERIFREGSGLSDDEFKIYHIVSDKENDSLECEVYEMA